MTNPNGLITSSSTLRLRREAITCFFRVLFLSKRTILYFNMTLATPIQAWAILSRYLLVTDVIRLVFELSRVWWKRPLHAQTVCSYSGHVAWHPTELTLATASFTRLKDLKLYRVDGTQMGATNILPGCVQYPETLEWRPDGTMLAYASGLMGKVHLFAYSKETLAPLDSLDVGAPVAQGRAAWFQRKMLLLRWHPSSDFFAVAHYNQSNDEAETIQFLRPDATQIGRIIQVTYLTAMDWHSSGKWLATFCGVHSSTSSGTNIEIWDSTTRHVATISTKVPNFAMAWHPTLPFLAVSTSDGTLVRFFNLDGTEARAMIGASFDFKRIGELVWHPKGRLLAVVSFDTHITLWDTFQGTLVTTIDGYPPVTWSPDGRYLAFNQTNDLILHRYI